MRAYGKASMEPPLLITVSFGSIDYEKSIYFTSRCRWAQKYGYEHLYINEFSSGFVLDAFCAAWLRLPLMRELKGRDLIYIDDDCIVSQYCPKASEISGGLDELFVARGHSGRPNSGVLFVSARGSDIFGFCVDRYNRSPPPECEAPYENGHVIWACTVHPWRPLPQCMNDTRAQDGMIVHHTGPNRALRSIERQESSNKKYDFSKETVADPTALRSMAREVLHGLTHKGLPR